MTELVNKLYILEALMAIGDKYVSMAFTVLMLSCFISYYMF